MQIIDNTSGNFYSIELVMPPSPQRTDGRADGRSDERTGGRATDGRTGGRADGRMDGRAGGRADARTNELEQRAALVMPHSPRCARLARRFKVCDRVNAMDKPSVIHP